MALAVGLPMSGLPFVGSAYGCPPPPGKGHLLTVGTLPRCFEGDLGDSATILGRERGVALAPGTLGTWVGRSMTRGGAVAPGSNPLSPRLLGDSLPPSLGRVT